ncbi:MAG: response regulator transcription factor [Mycobacterium kyogaense]|uniref:response regulator transcription factor n=1 Tax=Mycobacterium kyogaense TaxID=2212479 RepID=UPI002FF4D498
MTDADPRVAVLGKVLIIDDCALYREALASALRWKGIPRARTAWDLPSLIGALESEAPQVILLNLTADNMHTFLRAVRKLRPEVPVVAFATPEDDPDVIFACAEAGVAAYHMKADSLADLVVLIRLVAEGKTWCPPEIAATLLRRVSEVAGSRHSATRDSALTSREIQVLHMLELGRSNQDIALELSIAVHTVKNHVHNLLTKLGVNTRAEAAAAFHKLRMDHGDHQRSGSRSSQSWLR